jgi:hypothetical protein
MRLRFPASAPENNNSRPSGRAVQSVNGHDQLQYPLGTMLYDPSPACTASIIPYQRQL